MKVVELLSTAKVRELTDAPNVSGNNSESKRVSMAYCPKTSLHEQPDFDDLYVLQKFVLL